MKRVLISAGEASGDAYGAALALELRRLRSEIHIDGLGGAKMRAAGIAMLGDSARWGAISIVQSLRLIPQILPSYYRVKRELERDPGLFVPIDFGYANLRLARHAKSRGWKVLYFIPPSSWRRDRQGTDVAALSDEIVTPFPWSAEILRGMGASAHFFGHPIKSLPRSEAPRREGIALLPGSRLAELDTLLPLYAEAVRGLGEKIVIPVPTAFVPEVVRRWQSYGGGPVDVNDRGVGPALAGARAALVCSGTATLEAALARTPFAIVYRLTRSTTIEAKLIGFKPPKYVGLPNMILDRLAFPEILQDEATPKRLRAELDHLLKGEGEQAAAFEEIDTLLGPPDAVARTADLVVTMLG